MTRAGRSRATSRLRRAWDLCLYLLGPRHDLMRRNPGRRSSQGTVVHRPANIYLSGEDLAHARRRIGRYLDAVSRPLTEKRVFEVTRSAALLERQELVMNSFHSEVAETARWLASPRFEGITRLYSARQVVEQQGTIPTDYTVARMAAGQFYDRLRQLFAERKQITTFGPYSPGQAVALKRMGIEGIYLGGWATSAKGSLSEDPGPDLASYPLSQVPDEAADRKSVV